MEYSSAFFFVFYSSLTSLKIANEKDSASMSFKKHEATVFKLPVRKQNVFTCFDDCSCALARPNQRSIWFGLDFFGTFCIKAKST